MRTNFAIRTPRVSATEAFRFYLPKVAGSTPAPATQISMETTNVLKLQIPKSSFEAILKGEQKVVRRYVYPYNAMKYVFFKDENGTEYMNENEAPKEASLEPTPVQYDALCLINGRRKDAPRITAEVESSEFVIFTDDDGNDLTFEENGVEYIVCQVWYHLGNIIKTENV